LLIPNEINETNNTNDSKTAPYENNNISEDNVILNQDNNFTNDKNISNSFDKNETNQTTKKIFIKEYCIITASAKKFSNKQIKKFLSSFNNAKVEKVKNLYEFKIYGFKTYKDAKEFMNKKVIKIYKNPFIIKCERAK